MNTTVLNRRRGGIKGQIKKLSKFIPEDSDIADISNKIDILNRLEDKLDDLKLEYYKILKDDEIEECENDFDIIIEELQQFKVSFKRYLDLKKNNSQPQTVNNIHNTQKLSVKLPEIPLPKFDGSYENWNHFKAQFNSIIDSNDSLSNEQKLFYLQSSLTSSAKQIQSIDDTYESLYNALKNRFENKRLIVYSHIKSLLNLEYISSESAEKLRMLVDIVLKHIRALKVMKIEMNNFSESLLINIISQKLDKVTYKEYEMSLTSSDLPDWNNFIVFLEERCVLLENIQAKYTQIKSKPTQFQNKMKNFVLDSNSAFCNLCKKSQHGLYNCESFLKMNPRQRFDYVKKHKLCINCFSYSHQLVNCKSKYVCKICKSKHNYLLHREQGVVREIDSSVNLNECSGSGSLNQNSESSRIAEERTISQSLTSCFIAERKNVILATAQIYIKSNQGYFFKARCVLDSGSQISAISSKMANMLGLKQTKTNISISSLTGKAISVKKEVYAEIHNIDRTFSSYLNFLIVPKVTNCIPSVRLNISEFNMPSNITLADPEFYKPSHIDVLIGAELFFNVLKNKTINLTRSLLLKETVFGYVVSGAIEGNQNGNYCGFIENISELEENVNKFWQLENVEDSPSVKEEEIQCEKYFSNTHKRDAVTGKYIVNLPLKENMELGNSENLARTRLKYLFKRLDKDPNMKKLYIDFMEEYLKLGHMREIEFSNNLNYIMPHHGVYRAESSTTKLRVVYNGSAPSSNGVSLNNCLLKGGVVQEELFSILLRFRKYKIAFVADIQKMYRQIWVNPDQCNLQCVLWKNNSNEEPKLYELLTVTYGTSCAPFLATRVLKQLALDEQEHFPLASAATLSDFYVDDILTGADDLESALELQGQLIKMLRSAGMELHKWCSNSKELLDKVPINHKEYNFDETNKNSVKTLGLRWDPKEECFYFNVSSCTETLTKRSVLSEISRLFDPLGLLGPVITQAKLFMQRLWKLKLDWNQEIPETEKKDWEIFRKKLHELKNIKIPRFVLMDFVTVIDIHGFSDACKSSYGAVIYLRCIDKNGEIKVSLLCSKSRIAPMKEITIPRLELCGAVLLAKLVTKVISALKININKICLWCDSQIVLAWISKPLPQLKLFVQNRVKIIQELTDSTCWKYISSKDNPADVISRGVDADKLKGCNLWWLGPTFLHKELSVQPCDLVSVEERELYLKELKESPDLISSFVQDNSVSTSLDIIHNCSSYTKLQRVIAWCLRFYDNIRHPLQKTVGCLTSEELSRALTCIVKIVQMTAFPEEVQCLKKGRLLSNSSKLLNLCPFLDSQGVIRVGGRLKKSNLDLDQKHQILIPNNSNFTFLVINYFHVLFFHIGPEGTLAFIRRTFWIVQGRNVIRKILRSCISCMKVNANPSQQMMADLPAVRVIPSQVFSKVGLDFAGPFSVKTFVGRVKKLNKCYVCIFICLVVKAIHFEIVHNLTTDAFLGALKRFIARRNRPLEIFSDNATNFIGANNELRKIVKDLFKINNREKIEDYVSREGIKWNFNPPLAPHFGGLWEAGVRSLKKHLKRIVGNTVLSYEEFLTLVTQTEAILNSRPLCPLSNDPNDLLALTPAHFLVGSSLVALPEHDWSATPLNRLSRWQLVQKFTQTLWKRWTNEYLNKLQQRPKWFKGQVNFKEGDIVLVKNTTNSGYLKWHLARILKIHPGTDNIVRVITLKDKDGVFKRAVSSIVALPFVN